MKAEPKGRKFTSLGRASHIEYDEALVFGSADDLPILLHIVIDFLRSINEITIRQYSGFVGKIPDSLNGGRASVPLPGLGDDGDL